MLRFAPRRSKLSHQEITCVILCRLKYIIMLSKPFNDIIILLCKFPIGLCRLSKVLSYIIMSLKNKRHIFLNDI